MPILRCLIISLSLLFLWSCSGLPQSESKEKHRTNLLVEPITRQSLDCFFELKDPEQAEAPPSYPWQDKYISKMLRINKEFFRCKGNPLNPPLRVITNEGHITYQIDCEGSDMHSLPIRNGKEFIYPTLIDLLNHIQVKTGKKVIITSGHRCPTHNLYVNAKAKSSVSKHLMGAKVDFYVEGMEENPLKVIPFLADFCATKPLIKKEEKWVNQDMTITCHGAGEDRNGDNQHPYPYITVELTVPFSYHLGYSSFYRSK